MGASGVGGSQPIGPSGIPSSGAAPSGNVNLADIRIGSMNDLKRVLVENLGEEEGKKMYDQFMKSFVMGMMGPVQQAAERAKKASKEMREQQG